MVTLSKNTTKKRETNLKNYPSAERKVRKIWKVRLCKTLECMLIKLKTTSNKAE
jgi:hypothetical protein